MCKLDLFLRQYSDVLNLSYLALQNQWRGEFLCDRFVISLLKNEVGNEESWSVTDLDCSGISYRRREGRSAAANENSTDWLSHCRLRRYSIHSYRSFPARTTRSRSHRRTEHRN